VPKYNFSHLTSWFTHRSDLYRWRTIEYYLYRAETNLRLMSRLDLIGKTSEFAKVNIYEKKIKNILMGDMF